MRKNKTDRLIQYVVLIILLNLWYSTGNAFEVNKTSTGKDVKWFHANVPYSINTAGGPADSLNAITAAMQTWTDVPSANFTFVDDGLTSSTAWGKNDGTNLVCFGKIAQSAVLSTNQAWYTVSTGEISDSDIKFNTNFSWATDGSSDKYDVQDVATHELGHCLSLSDLYGSGDTEKTMYGYSAPGETKKRTLDQDDINGIIYLYGTTNTTTIPVSTTTTIISTGPCAAALIYGENSEQTELLREYRDNVLSKTSEGQEMIKTYYKLSPAVTKLLEQSPLLKNKVKELIDSMLPGIRQKVEESNKEQ